MAEIYIEWTNKKTIAWSLEWPGWCRIRRDEAEAVEAMRAYAPRYQPIAERVGRPFAPGALVVAERIPGDSNTAWGVPSALAAADTQPIAAATAQRQVALLRAAWDLFADTIADSPAELRKGPRGGGRDRDTMWAHVIGAERSYARKIGVRHPPFAPTDADALAALRADIAAALGQPSTGAPLIPGGWLPSYAVRRIAWHVVDHLWETEDRREPLPSE